MNTEALVKNYYAAWLENDRDKARSLLADQLKFRSPQDCFDDADSFMNECWKFAENFNKMDIEHGVYSDEAAYIVYSGEDFCCGELIKIDESKISEIYVTFEPTR